MVGPVYNMDAKSAAQVTEQSEVACDICVGSCGSYSSDSIPRKLLVSYISDICYLSSLAYTLLPSIQ